MITELLDLDNEKRRFYLAFGGLVFLAWAAIIALQASQFAELVGHEAIEANSVSKVLRLGVFLLSWLLMTVAMMLPGALPQLSHVIRTDASTAGRGLPLVLGYIAPWILFGVLIDRGDTLLHRWSELPEIAAYSAFIAPVVMLVAGLYQLTPLKANCLQRCRTVHRAGLPPGAMHTAAMPEGLETAGSGRLFRQGLRLGLLCVGSCWSLMLLLFALGGHRLDWMVAATAIMAGERLTPWGSRLARLIGLALIAWAVIWFLTTGSAGHAHM